MVLDDGWALVVVAIVDVVVNSTRSAESELALQMRIKTVFDPDWLLNPGKVFPLHLAPQGLAHQA